MFRIQNIGFRIQDFRFIILDLGSKPGLGHIIYDFRFLNLDLGFRPGLGYMI